MLHDFPKYAETDLIVSTHTNDVTEDVGAGNWLKTLNFFEPGKARNFKIHSLNADGL